VPNDQNLILVSLMGLKQNLNRTFKYAYFTTNNSTLNYFTNLHKNILYKKLSFIEDYDANFFYHMYDWCMDCWERSHRGDT
jgi:hypothetical protein